MQKNHPLSQHKHSLRRMLMLIPQKANIEKQVSQQCLFLLIPLYKTNQFIKTMPNLGIVYYSIFYTKILRIRIANLNSKFPINHLIFLICHLIKWHSQISHSQFSFVYLK